MSTGFFTRKNHIESILSIYSGLALTCLDLLSQVIAILDRLKDERESSGPKDEGQAEVPNLSQEDRDWNKDDPDEGIIYVD